MPTFSKKSQGKLDAVNPKLQQLFNEVIKEVDCTILEGKRTMERQAELFAQGRSHTMNSKHLEGNAVDVMPYPINWGDKQGQHNFAVVVYDTAMKLGIKVRWGGRFRNFYDSPHWELI